MDNIDDKLSSLAIEGTSKVLDETAAGEKAEDKDEKPMMEEDGFGADDYFSRLPNLCILEIFKHVKRVDLATMMTVSKRFRPFYYDKSLESIKWEKGHLIIFQNSRGYAIRFRLDNDKNPWKICSYHYEAHQNVNGSIEELRRVNVPIEFPSSQKLDWPIPDELFTALAEILKHHEVASLRFGYIPFTPMLFTKLHGILEEHRIRSLVCSNMHYESITDDLRTSFARFVKGIHTVELASPDLPSVLNDEVLEVMAGSKLRQFRLNFDDYSLNARKSYGHRFPVSESKLKELVKMSTFEAPEMEIKMDYLAQFVKDYMEARDADGEKDGGRWMFGLEEYTDTNRVARNFSEPEYDIMEGADYFTIIRNKDRLSATICDNLYDAGDQVLLIGTVTFGINSPFCSN